MRSVLHAGKIINDESVQCGKIERNYRFLDLQIKNIEHLARVWVVFTCRDVHIAMTRSDVLYILSFLYYKWSLFLIPGLEDSDDDDLDMDYNNQRLIKDLLATLCSGSDEECSVCLDSLVEPVITRCAHAFCQQCIMDVITSENLAPHCPLCRAPLNENELIKVPEKKKQKSPPAEKTSEESEGKEKSSKV